MALAETLSIDRDITLEAAPVEACSDGQDFVPMEDPFPGINQLRALVSRHVDCRSGRSEPVPLFPSATHNAGQPLATARFESKLSVFGPSTALRKWARLTLRVFDVVGLNDGVDQALPMVAVMPRFACGSAAELAGQAPSCTVTGGPITVPLDGREAVGDYVIAFDWTPLVGQRKDVLTFDLTFHTFELLPSMAGRVAQSVYQFDSGLDAAGVRIRRDRGVAKAGSDGCVLPQAAAVFRVDASAPKGAEAVLHMEEAMAAGAPGRFRPKLGFRAIADEAALKADRALQRTQIPLMRAANRHAACGDTRSSIIQQRPKQSRSCAESHAVGCDCDEYPFASTYQGAFEQWATTSAKYLQQEDNRAIGSALASFYARERIIDLSYETGQPGVPTNPYPGFVRVMGGDLFWVEDSATDAAFPARVKRN